MPVTGQAVAPDGTAQTNPVVIPDVGVGPTVTWFTFSRQERHARAVQLILYIDEAEGLPFEANALDIVVQPDWLLARGWWRP